MQQMARPLFRPAWRDRERPDGESTVPPIMSAPEPYIRHRPTEPWELQRIEAALLIPPDEADTLKAVCAHITQHSGDPSSRALAGLVRALYQDSGNFNFESLDCLGPLMRRHAERLISARLWSALTDHEWQQAYSAVASYEFKDNVTKLASPPKSASEPTLVSESRLAGSPKGSAEIKAAFDPQSGIEPKPASDSAPAVDTRPVSEGKGSADAKPALEPRRMFEPGARDESRVFAKAQSVSAPSPLHHDAPVPQPLPHEQFPHADSFNFENIGRHWRIVLWFAMAAVGLAVVTYI
jgi:hypothetical protein